MALFHSLDTVQPLIELTRAMVQSPEGPLTAAQRQQRALVNMGLTGTIAQINEAALGTMAPVLPGDVTSYNVLAANSGRRHIIPDLTATCTFTLPTGAAGNQWIFQTNAIAADAQNWVFTAPAGVFYRGGVVWYDLNGGAAGDEVGTVNPNGSSHITLTVVTPAAGTSIEIFWDGTRYVINGSVVSDTTPAFS